MFLPPRIVNSHATESVSSSDVYRGSLRSAVLDKVQSQLKDSIRMKPDEMNSLKTIEHQLNDGTQRIDGLISQIHNQQQQIEVTTTARYFLVDSSPSFSNTWQSYPIERWTATTRKINRSLEKILSVYQLHSFNNIGFELSYKDVTILF